MTATEMAMTDEPEAMGSQLGRIGLIILSLFGTVFGVGVAAGILAAHLDRGGPIGLKLVALIAGAILLAAAFAWLGYRSARALTKAVGKPTTRERRNYLVLLGCGAIGGVLGVALTLGGGSPLDTFSDSPIPTWLALLLTVPILVLLPAISFYWHRHVVDEQEEAAYKLGALLGIYTYFIAAPAWWLLWRGGLLPEPDGILIYFATITVTGVTWIWAKYR
jgi:hypothetical protein